MAKEKTIGRTMEIEAASKNKEPVAEVSAPKGVLPALAQSLFQILKAVGYDPAKLNALVETDLTAIKDALPPTAKSEPAKSEPYTAPALIEKYKFETFKTDLGIGCKFTQPKGVTLLSMAKEINKVSLERLGRNAISKGILLKDAGMKTFPQKAIEHEFVPIVNDSNQHKHSNQEQFLKDKCMVAVDRAVLTISAGLYRLNKGDPMDLSHIGTPYDNGDIFKGHVSRARSGAVVSEVYGVDAFDDDYYVDDDNNTCTFIAGAPASYSGKPGE